MRALPAFGVAILAERDMILRISLQVPREQPRG
jgi:hypothetical protein